MNLNNSLRWSAVTLLALSSAASADTIALNFGGNGSASGTATLGSTPTISAEWSLAQNVDQSLVAIPTNGVLDLTGLTLLSVSLNNATGIGTLLYGTATNAIGLSSTDPYSINGKFTDPTSVTLTFNATSGACAASSVCEGNFGISGDVLYSLLSASVATPLGITSIPPALDSIGTLTLTFKGTLTTDASGNAVSYVSGGASPVFSGGSTFDTKNNPPPPPAIPEPSTLAFAGLGVLAIGFGVYRRKSGI